MKDSKFNKVDGHKLISISPKKQHISEISMKNESEETNQKKQIKLQIINNPNKKDIQNCYNFKKDMKLQTRKDFNLSKFLKRQFNNQQKQVSISDIEKQIEQQNRNCPNVINMQFIFTVYKNNYKKLQDLKKKLAMYEYEREMGIQHYQLKHQQFLQYQRQKQQYQKQEKYIHNMQPSPQKDIKQFKDTKQTLKIPVIYDFKELQKLRLNKMKQTIKKQQKQKKSPYVHLSPIKKYTTIDTVNTNNDISSQLQKYRTLRKYQERQKSNKKQSQQKSELIEINGINKKKFVFIGSSYKMRQTQYQNKKQGFGNFSTRPKSQERKKSYDPIKQFSLTKRNFYKKDHFVFGLSTSPTAQNKVQFYRDFLWKINMSNNIFIQPQVQLQKNYKIYIGRGNNSMLIKGLIKRRFWWTVVEKPNEQTNFIWSQLKQNDFFKYQNNHIKQKTKSQSDLSINSLNTTISTNSQSQNKKSQVQKPTKQKDKQAIKLKDYHQNIFSQYDLNLWNHYLQKNRKCQQQLSNNVYSKRAFLLKHKNAIKIYNCQKLKVHNHFNSNFFIGNKKALFYSMRKYYQLNNLNVFDYLPLTFHIAKGLEDPQFQKFSKQYIKLQQNKQIKNIWIVKPGQFTNRGTGITVCANIEDVKVRLRGRQKNSNGKLRTFIVQKYLQRPFLYHRRKFDIRHYMMMTCINGLFKGYWYQQGYIRTTSYEYNIKNCKDNSIHLTNDAIQKYTQEYGKYQKGNKLSYQQFQKYLDNHHKNSNFNFFEVILPKMKSICTDAIRASYFLMDPQRKNHNFQIFGLDFMIDQQFNPWLIQINTNPCLQLSSPLLAKIIPNMVQNAFKIGLDPLFQPPYNWPLNKKYQLGQNPLTQNKFTIIFDQKIEGEQIQDLYKNVQRVDKNMGQIEQEDEQYEDQGKQWNQQD